MRLGRPAEGYRYYRMRFIFFKSLTYLKFKNTVLGWYHIYMLRHWVDVICQGATALAGSFKARAGNFFALAVRSRLTVLVRGFSDGGVQCTSGTEDARVPGYKCTSRRLIPGCSNYSPQVQCISGAEDARLKKFAKSSSFSCLWGLEVLWCVIASEYLLNSTVRQLCTAGGKSRPQVQIEPRASMSHPPSDAAHKCNTVQCYIFKILKMKTT
jgi:hypothetical protein